jgi:hypothetical protein
MKRGNNAQQLAYLNYIPKVLDRIPKMAMPNAFNCLRQPNNSLYKARSKSVER